MASRSGRRRVDHSSPLVDLDDVFADDALIDAIAAGPWGPEKVAHRAGVTGGRHATPAPVEPLIELFDNWRCELAQTPFPDLPAMPKTVGVGGGPRPKRSHRPALAVAAAIAALLVGSTFVGSRQATEGSVLWNVTAVLWPERLESVASRDRVLTAIDVAEAALSQGRPDAAQAALLDASFEIGKVDDADGRQDLQSSLEGLWKKAAPAGSPTPSEQVQLAAGSSTPTARSTTSTAAQLAAVDLLPTGAQVAAPLSSSPGSTGSVAAIGASSPGGGAGGSVGVAAPTTAVKPGSTGGESVSAVQTPSASEPAASTPPSTDQPTTESPSSVTEPAPAPTPSLSTSTPDSAESGTVDSAGSESADQLTAESSSTGTAESTAVLPSP